MTISSLGLDLSNFFIQLGNHAPRWVGWWAWIGSVIFLASVVYEIRKQIKRRVVLYGFVALAVCAFFNPLWFLPYEDACQTVLLLVLAPLAMGELRWRKLFTKADWMLLNVPLWHWSVGYCLGCLSEA